jgi:chromosome segregation ATPase
MPQPEAGTPSPQPPRLDTEPWRDKVLTDAIGHTRGLVALLDSLNEAFLRRGQELTEAHQRLEILQTERRRIIEERTRFEEQIRTLEEDRDRARTDLGLRTRDLEQASAELQRLQETMQSQVLELEALRASLADVPRQAAQLEALQKERQALLEERAALEEQLRERSSENLLLQTQGLEKDAERERLSGELARLQSAFSAGEEEIRTLKAAGASATKQAEDLRRIVRWLERDRDTAARHHAERLAELDQAQERRSAETVRVEREAAALREQLAQAQTQLESATREAAAAAAERQALTIERDAARLEAEQRLEAPLARARAEVTEIEERFRTQAGECARLAAAVESLQTVLASIGAALDRNVSAADLREAEADPAAPWRPILDAVLAQRTWRQQAEKERESLQATLRAMEEALGTSQGLPDRLHDLLAERDHLTQQVQALARDAESLRAELASATRQSHEIQAERNRLAARVAALAAEVEVLRAPTTPPAAPQRMQESAPPPARPQSAPPMPSAPVAQGKTPFQDGQLTSAQKMAGPLELQVTLLLESQAEGAGDTASVQVTGPVSAVNHAGLVIALERPLAVGQAVSVRLLRTGVTMVVPGTVVRTQSATAGADKRPRADHLVRFEHPGLESLAHLKAFLA